MRPWPFLLLVLLAGCAQPGAPAEEPAPAPLASTIPWSLVGCLHAVWSAPAPMASLQSRVPPGFTVLAGPGGLGQLWFEAFACDKGDGLDGLVSPMAYGSLFVRVSAPSQYGCDGLDGGCYVKTDVLVPDAPRREWLVAQGVSARDGSAEVRVDAAGTWTASLVLDGVGGFGMQGARLQPQPGSDALFAEFMQDRCGVTVWRATSVDVSTSPGTGAWSADPGSWVANEVGTAGPTQWSGGTWSFVDGIVTASCPEAQPAA